MGLTFDQLLEDRTREDFAAQLFKAMQGIGYVSKAGTGTGNLSASGVAAAAYSVRIKIIATGGLGSGTFQYSTDGGGTYSATTTIPANGSYVVGATGVSVLFEAGPTGSTDHFVAGDLYSFELTIPTIPVESWQPGATGPTIVEIDADVSADLAAAIKAVAAGGLLNTATGSWLDLLADNVYATTRIQGVAARGNVTLSDPAGAGPFVITPGQLWVGTIDGRKFTNTSGGTLPKNGTLLLPFQAEQVGGSYNLGAGGITVLFTPLPGVTVSNASNWLTTQGRNTETDAELRARAKLKWPELGIGSPAEAYDLWAKTASANVNRTKVRPSPTIAGTAEVYLAGPAGTVNQATIDAVDAYIQPRVPLTSFATVQSAAAHNWTVVATAYVAAGYGAAALTEIQANLAAYSESIALGGTIYLTQVIEEIMSATGVRNTVVTTPAADAAMGATSVAVLTPVPTITIVEV